MKEWNFLVYVEVARAADLPTCPGPTKISAESLRTNGGSRLVPTRAEGGPARLQGHCGHVRAGVASKFGFDFRPNFLPVGQSRLPQLHRQREDCLWMNPGNEMVINIKSEIKKDFVGFLCQGIKLNETNTVGIRLPDMCGNWMFLVTEGLVTDCLLYL